jgi:heat shock protein HtpX
MKLLTPAELKGVLAHEIAHVKNRDILISTIAATIASVISYVGFIARFIPLGGRNNNNNGSNILSLILLSILAPIAAMIIQLAISRSREYLADESGAKYLHDGTALASALEKLHTVKIPRGFASQATAHMFIANPLSGQAFMNLFSTHPDHRSRVAKLRSMKF